MASVSVLAAHVSVLVSEVPALSTGSREPASKPNLNGLHLGLGVGHPCLGLGLGLGLGGPGLDYNPGMYVTLTTISNISTYSTCVFGHIL